MSWRLYLVCCITFALKIGLAEDAPILFRIV